MKKLLADGFTTKIACPTGSFRVLVVSSTSTLRYLSALLCSAWTSRTRSQIITDCLGGPAVCPETSTSKPGAEKHHPGIVRSADSR